MKLSAPPFPPRSRPPLPSAPVTSAGYAHGSQWRDIMSYKANCGGCSRSPVWSNPDVLIGGAPAGSVGHDNARVIADNVLRVAAFR